MAGASPLNQQHKVERIVALDTVQRLWSPLGHVRAVWPSSSCSTSQSFKAPLKSITTYLPHWPFKYYCIYFCRHSEHNCFVCVHLICEVPLGGGGWVLSAPPMPQSHFTGEKLEAQRGDISCPRSHSQSMVELGVTPEQKFIYLLIYLNL